MTYNQALDKINSLLLFGSRPGLDRIKSLLELMGNPQDRLKFVHVAGTNGKGSTCAIISQVLKAAGYKTGLFISPYIVDFCDRMQINGKMISHEDLIECVESIFPLIEQLKEQGIVITEFEFVTAIAFKWYADNNCDIVVLETGMGGKLDCTNVIKTPLVSVITSISLDHTAVLGDSLELIAIQKSGIIKQDGNTVFYPQEEIVNRVIEMYAVEYNNSILRADTVPLNVKEYKITGTVLQYGGRELKLNLIGRHQLKNSKTALGAIEILRREKGFKITDDNIAEGFSKAVMPARLELLSEKPVVLLDGAHNPDGMYALSGAIKDYLPGKKIVCIMGMLKDKDSNSSLEYLDGLVDAVITLEPDNPRKQTSYELAEKAVKFFDMVYPMENFDLAVKRALNIAGENGAVVVCGSLYLASQLRPILMRNLKNCGYN